MNTPFFVVAEYLFLRKFIMHTFGIDNKQMLGDTHRSGGYMSLKVYGTFFTTKMVADINSAFCEKFGKRLKMEKNNGAYVFTKIV